jgi:N-acetylglutamate synthase-like GNAT family acetyltransferase
MCSFAKSVCSGSAEESLDMRLGTLDDAHHIHKLLCHTYSDPKLLARPLEWERITLPEVHEKMKCGQFLVGVEHNEHINSNCGVDDADIFALGVCVFIDTSLTSHLTEMNCLAVHPKLQGRSVSLAVLDAAFAFAHESGYTHVESDVLSIRPHLVSALALHPRPNLTLPARSHKMLCIGRILREDWLGIDR